LFAIGRGDQAAGVARLREAADAGEPYAMTDLALVLAADHPDEAMAWARRSIETAPEYPSAFGALGRIALAAGRPDVALPTLDHALAYDPDDAASRAARAIAELATTW
jgi:tetratricopeptide (TPR) repeat protein